MPPMIESRVTDVRKNSLADGCDQTARLRRRSHTCEQSAKQGTGPRSMHSETEICVRRTDWRSDHFHSIEFFFVRLIKYVQRAD